MDDKIEFLPIHVLREPKVKLRDVNRESLEYLEMRDSILDKGILQSLLVRPVDGDLYEIIEGLHRYTASKEVGLENLPCIIRECTDDEALVLQLAANAISPETKLAEYAQQLKRLMKRNPDMTIAEVSCLIRKAPSWVGKCLNLVDLLKEVQVMVTCRQQKRNVLEFLTACCLARLDRSLAPSLLPGQALSAAAA
jgi:ParB family chromosome partitioning protein